MSGRLREESCREGVVEFAGYLGSGLRRELTSREVLESLLRLPGRAPRLLDFCPNRRVVPLLSPRRVPVKTAIRQIPGKRNCINGIVTLEIVVWPDKPEIRQI